MSLVQLSAGALNGVIQGQFGTYQVGSDGVITVDTRDAAALLAAGAVYINKQTRNYTLPKAPAAASAAGVVASAALSNGTLTIAAQPDVMRPLAVIMGAGTVAVTAGSVALTYTANDGTTQVDTLSAIMAASASQTLNTTKGVQKLVSAVVAGIAGGASPFIEVGTIASLSVPVDAGTVDFSVFAEIVDGSSETVGTVSTATLGSIAPTTAPNGTHTYGFMWNAVVADQ